MMSNLNVPEFVLQRIFIFHNLVILYTVSWYLKEYSIYYRYTDNVILDIETCGFPYQ